MSTCMGLVLVAGLVAMEDQALPSVATHTSLRQRLLEQQVSNDWHTEFNGAHAEARDLGLPLVIHFHAEWCDACERMQESVLNQPAMRERLGRSAVGVQLDVDGNPKLVSIFNVTALPTDVFVRADGCVLSQSTGGRSLESYLALVDGLAVEVAADATDGVKLGPEAWHQLAESEEGSSEFGDSKCVMRRENGEVIGMGGYSPVALARDRTWLQGRPELSARHEGIKYYFATEDELAAFQADPSRYAPQLLGCDPVVLTSQSRVLPGRIELGLFFKEQIYFFASDTSRSMFRTNPRRYVDSAGMVELDVADIETSM